MKTEANVINTMKPVMCTELPKEASGWSGFRKTSCVQRACCTTWTSYTWKTGSN